MYNNIQLQKGCVLLFSSVKNFLISFLIALASFGVVAFLVVAIVVNSIGGAFMIDPFGKGETSDIETEDPEVPGINTEAEGNSLYILAVVTDYRPSFYGDYDYSHIKSTIGVAGGGLSFPSDLKPSSDKITSLPEKPADGTLDISPDGTPNIIGGLEENTYRTIHNDITLLIRMDKENKQFTFTPFPSNTVITYENERVLLRDVFYKSGIDGVVNAVHVITGIRPDRYVLVHSEYVDELIDAIGGLDMSIAENMSCNDPENGLKFDLLSGQSTLSGDIVQQMLRYDGYSSESSMNIEHFGMNVIRAFISKLTQPGGYSTAGANFTLVKNYLITDMTLEDITQNRDLWYGYSAFGKLQIDVIGKEVEEDGEVIFKLDDNATMQAFIPYRKAYNK